MFRRKSSDPPISNFEDFSPLSQKEDRAKVPPGQYVAKRWPVLSVERTPKFNGKDWDVSVEGLVQNPIKWTWEEFMTLPKVDQVSDLHCVTTWSLLDQKFSGVSFQTILDIVQPLPEAEFVTFEAVSGYTTAIPLKDAYLLENDVMLVYEHDNKPLPAEHGGPLRSLVPQLYLWKSVKWLTKMSFKNVWERGFWEIRNYHQRGDIWLEERYSSQERVRRRGHKIEN